MVRLKPDTTSEVRPTPDSTSDVLAGIPPALPALSFSFLPITGFMRMSCLARAACGVTLLLALAQPAAAQLYESVGTRAKGMGGAFVAVADDATATWWNPAGIAAGPALSALYERGEETQPADPLDQGPASRLKPSAFAVAFPALGLSYYRLRISEIAAISPTAPPPAGRQDLGATPTFARTLALSQFGATFGQSAGALVLASTLKLMRGGVTRAVAAAQDPLDAADDLDVETETHADLDLGVLVNAGSLRAGFSVRNLRQPSFGSDDDERLELKRKARAGVAFMVASGGGVLDALTVASDFDLTKTSTLFGDVRHAAVGAEAYLAKRHIGVRGGLQRNTVGESSPAYSYGFSAAPTTGVYFDFARTRGKDETVEGWNAGVRLTF